jgi:hypothetical protein
MGKRTAVHVNLRLSGEWATLWQRLRASVPTEISDAELLQEAIALRMAISAVNKRGEKPRAFIQFHDENDECVTVDLLRHIGMEPSSELH